MPGHRAQASVDEVVEYLLLPETDVDMRAEARRGDWTGRLASTHSAGRTRRTCALRSITPAATAAPTTPPSQRRAAAGALRDTPSRA